MEKINTITLPSFLRRTMKAYALKAHMRQQGCELNRIGRSRNWLLKANFDQLQEIITFIELTSEPSWMWLTKLLKSQYLKTLPLIRQNFQSRYLGIIF